MAHSITQNLALTKLGANTLTLTGSSTYSGATTVSGGTLQLGDGTSGHDASLATSGINDNSVLIYNVAALQTANYSISGSGTLMKTGSGTLIVSQPNTFAGPTIINQGLVKLAPGLFTLSGFGGNGTNWTTNGATILSNSLTITDNNNGEARTAFYDLPLSTGRFNASFTYQVVGANGNNADGTVFMLQNDPRGTGAVGGSGGSEGYAGITNSAGISLDIYHNAPGGVGTSYVFNSTSGSVNNPANTGNNATPNLSTTSSTGSVDLSSGDPIQVNLAYDGSNNLVETLTDLTTSATWSTTYAAGSLAATTGGATALIGFGGGTGGLNALQQISNFSFSTVVNSNVLPTTTPLIISAQSTLDLNGVNQQVASLTDGNGSGSIINSNSTAAVLTLSATGGTTTFSGMIEGGGTLGTLGLVLGGNGAQVLAGSNTYTGGTAVDSGVLVAARAASLPLTGGVSVAGGAALVVQTGNETIGWSGSQIDSLLGVATWTNSTSVLGIDTSSGSFTYGTSITQTLALTKRGANTLTLTGSSTYSGATVVSGGTLQLGDGTSGHDAALATSGITNNSALTYNVFNSQSVNYPISGPGTLTKTGPGVLVVTSSNTYGGGTTVSGGTLQFGDGTSGHDPSLATSSITNNGVLAYNVFGSQTANYPIGGSGTLTKTGSGTLLIVVANTYTGPTVIDQGTLQMQAGLQGLTLPSNFNLNGSVVHGYQDDFNSPTLNPNWAFASGGSTPNGTNPGYYTETAGTNGQYYLHVTTAANGDPNHMLYIPNGMNADGNYTVLALVQLNNTNTSRGGIGAAIPEVNGNNLSANNGLNMLFGGNYGSDNMSDLFDNKSWGPQITSGNNYQANTLYWMQFSVSGGTSTSSELWPADGATSQNSITSTTWNLAAAGLPTATGFAGITSTSDGGELDMNVYYMMIENSQLPSITVGGGGSVPATTAMTIASGAKWDLNGTAETVASLSDGGGGGGSIINSNTGSASVLTISPTGGSTTFSGNIDGTVGSAISLVMTGTGRQVLTGSLLGEGSVLVDSARWFSVAVTATPAARRSAAARWR